MLKFIAAQLRNGDSEKGFAKSHFAILQVSNLQEIKPPSPNSKSLYQVATINSGPQSV